MQNSIYDKEFHESQIHLDYSDEKIAIEVEIEKCKEKFEESLKDITQ
jgi:hypothetical protein